MCMCMCVCMCACVCVCVCMCVCVCVCDPHITIILWFCCSTRHRSNGINSARKIGKLFQNNYIIGTSVLNNR